MLVHVSVNSLLKLWIASTCLIVAGLSVSTEPADAQQPRSAQQLIQSTLPRPECHKRDNDEEGRRCISHISGDPWSAGLRRQVVQVAVDLPGDWSWMYANVGMGGTFSRSDLRPALPNLRRLLAGVGLPEEAISRCIDESFESMTFRLLAFLRGDATSTAEVPTSGKVLTCTAKVLKVKAYPKDVGVVVLTVKWGPVPKEWH